MGIKKGGRVDLDCIVRTEVIWHNSRGKGLLKQELQGVQKIPCKK